MGAKAAILAFGDGDITAVLRQMPHADADRTRTLVAEIFPGYDIDPVRGWPLAESTYPDTDTAYALSAASIDILCDKRFQLQQPSELPGHVLDVAAGRRRAEVVLCEMHSVDDSFGYAIWRDGQLVRSLSMSLTGGITENLGEPLEFELPFWARQQAFAASHPGGIGFHPLDLGEQALRFLFGFVLEGRPEPDDVAADQVAMLGYRVTDPTGAEQAEREAALQEFVRTHTRRIFRPGRDGSLTEKASGIRFRMGPDGLEEIDGGGGRPGSGS